jgi:uncharacterized protein YbjT (DUF2867 family)
MRALIAGATGFVGRRLASALAGDGLDVRCLVRDASSDAAAELLKAGCEIVEADLSHEADLTDAMNDVDIAYFLVHMMGRETDYAAAERRAAEKFAAAAKAAGVEQIVYLGGLGEDPTSPHLLSREETARALAENGPALTYVRAGMIVGAGSESYVLVRDIARRLPLVPDPAWMRTRTQPIGIRDVIAYLRRIPFVKAAMGREIQIGGPDVLTPREIVDQAARATGRTPPRRLPGTGATPGAVAAAVSTVTTGDRLVAAELTHGLSSDTVVTDPSGAELFADVHPEPLDVILQRALEEDERQVERNGR